MRQPVQELIERYQKNLYAAAFNICKNQMDAEDVHHCTVCCHSCQSLIPFQPTAKRRGLTK